MRDRGEKERPPRGGETERVRERPREGERERERSIVGERECEAVGTWPMDGRMD